MDRQKATEIISLSKIEGQAIADSIKLNSLKKKGTARLSYLISEENKIKSIINSTIPCFNYDLKSELYNHHLEHNVLNYLQTTSYNQSFQNFRSYWKGFHEEILSVESPHTTQDFLSINRGLLTLELQNVIEKEDNENLHELDEAPIVLSILSLFEALDEIEAQIADAFIFSHDISNDKLDELRALFDSRIKWLGSYKEFVFLFEELFNNYWIGLDNTSSKSKAILSKSHFFIPVKQGEVTLISLRDEFTRGIPGSDVEELFVIKENIKRKEHS